MKKRFGQIITVFKRHRQINNFIICLCISLFLWIFITYGGNYQHNITCTINFIDSEHKVEYFTPDSVITIGVKANGFEYLFKRSNFDRQTIDIDVDKLNINLSKGKAKIMSSILKNQILEKLDYRGIDISITPPTIDLRWNNVYSKKVKIINRTKFKCKKPYELYTEPEIMMTDIVIEGQKKQIEKINSINTKPITYENIDKSGIFLVPLDLELDNGITYRMNSVPIRIHVEKYTENVAILPVSVVRYENYRNIKLLPKQVKLRYRVAIKDFTKINEKQFNAFVLCSDENMSINDRLKVNISGIPDYVKVVSVYPQKVEYILFK